MGAEEVVGLHTEPQVHIIQGCLVIAEEFVGSNLIGSGIIEASADGDLHVGNDLAASLYHKGLEALLPMIMVSQQAIGSLGTVMGHERFQAFTCYGSPMIGARWEGQIPCLTGSNGGSPMA